MEAKYFCSLTRNSIELTKLAPALHRRGVDAEQQVDLVLDRHLHRVLLIGVFHDTSPTPGDRRQLHRLGLHLGVGLGDRRRPAARPSATPSVLRSLVAAKPQAPLAITRTPTPVDSVLTTFWTLSSRVITNWLQVAADAHVAVGGAGGGGGVQRGVGQRLLLATSSVATSSSAAIARPKRHHQAGQAEAATCMNLQRTPPAPRIRLPVPSRACGQAAR